VQVMEGGVVSVATGSIRGKGGHGKKSLSRQNRWGWRYQEVTMPTASHLCQQTPEWQHDDEHG
jgi:hypothetical protein